MYTPEIWQEAYANIYANKGAVTKGIDDNTLDGMSQKRINRIITMLKERKYKPKPVRRTYIPKKNGKLRPLGIPSGDEKLVQEVTRLILARIYEPIFTDNSTGFREGRSCHTALERIKKTWTGVKWFIEFDIKSFFDEMNHGKMIELLEKKIKDKRFLKLIRSMLTAGYLQDWKYHTTYSGVPQGGIVSPILSNIYLHELDKFIQQLADDFSKGKRRPVNPEYRKLRNRKHSLRKKIDQEGKQPELMIKLRELDKQMKQLPYGDAYSCEYKRLLYCRYADDFVCGIIGSKQEAEEVKEQVILFLEKKLSLNIAPEKTRIESAKKGIKFLSYKISTWGREKIRKMKISGRYVTKRTTAENIQLSVPQEKVIQIRGLVPKPTTSPR